MTEQHTHAHAPINRPVLIQFWTDDAGNLTDVYFHPPPNNDPPVRTVLPGSGICLSSLPPTRPPAHATGQ
jgi:hypothetical protein